MKKTGYFLFLLGIIIAAFGMNMETTIEAGGQTIGSGNYSVTVPISRVNNIGLMEDRRLILTGAGLSLLLGSIFIGFGTLSTITVSVKNTSIPSQATSNQQPRHLRKFISGESISPEDVEGLAAVAGQYPSVLLSTSRMNGNSLLHLAASYGLHDAVELLLKAGADKSNRNGNGKQAYQLANEVALANILRVVA